MSPKTARLPDGRTHENAVADVLENLKTDPNLHWIGADASVIARCIERWTHGHGGPPHVAEALWRHYEELNA